MLLIKNSMRIVNKYSFFVVNRLGVMLPVWIICYIFSLKVIALLALFFAVCSSIHFFVFSNNFIISNSKIIIESKENREIYLKNIEKIVFVDRNNFLTVSQTIEISLTNGKKVMINCNGIYPDDGDTEYEKSFYKIYEYTQSVYQHTYFKEYIFHKSIM